MFEFVLPFVILIIVVVFIHEYGHYYFARRYGVGVTDFSIYASVPFAELAPDFFVPDDILPPEAAKNS